MTVHVSDGETDSSLALCDGGEAATTHALRNGGTLTVSAAGIVVDRDERFRVDADDVVEVTLESIDYFLLVLSLAIVGFGVLSLERSLPAGLVFVAIGLASTYRTYRRRDALRIRVSGRGKPLVVYPENPAAVATALEEHVAAD